MHIYKRPAVIFDRDNTISKGGRCDRASTFALLPGAREAMTLLRRAGFLLVVATDQGALGEDLNGNVVWEGARLTRAHLGEIHCLMNDLLGPKAKPDSIKFCPHAPGVNDLCACHKPRPGMILEAAAELNVDLPRSFMVGDRVGDIMCGNAAGVHPILVRTGDDPGEFAKVPPEVAFDIVDNLGDAAALILRRSGLR